MVDDAQDEVLKAAADWQLRLAAEPANPELRKAFDLWIAVSPAHAEAWESINRAWDVLGAAAPGAVTPASSPRLAGVHGPRPRFGLLAGIAAAAVLAVAILPDMVLGIRADIQTGVGDVRIHELEDGSRVYLGPSSAIDVSYSEDTRKIALLEGEAFFEVTPNASRPFLVQCGRAEIKVVGTAFQVRQRGNETSVSVQHGVVAVTPDLRERAARVSLTAGERLTLDDQGHAEEDRIEPGEVASWRAGRLFVEGRTVADVVDELRAYHSGWIVIADDTLAKQRVTGVFDLQRPEDALRALVRPYQGSVHAVTPLLLVLSSS